MRAWLGLCVAILVGCSPASASVWVPSAALRGALLHGRSDGAWDWRVSVDASWDLAGSPLAELTPEPRPMPTPSSATPCASARLCGWEWRARARALERIRRSR